MIDLRRISSNYLVIVSLAVVTGCDVAGKYNRERYTSDVYDDFSYNFGQPDTVFLLPAELAEISGLTNFHDTHLLAVQDEKGIVYELDISTGQITRKIKFEGGGDYEGIEYVDPVVSVVKSNGNVYQFKYPQSDKEVTTDVYKTSFKSHDEIEGLGYLSDDEALLLTNKVGKEKGLYRFTTDHGLHKKHSFVTKAMVEKFAEERQIELLTPIAFKPSGIAVHPTSKHIYILAHTGKCIVILDQKNNISGFVQLNPSLFSQPEGICFTSDGTLYISNEANFGTANIVKFSMKK